MNQRMENPCAEIEGHKGYSQLSENVWLWDCGINKIQCVVKIKREPTREELTDYANIQDVLRW